MSGLPLFYSSVVPLDSVSQRGHRLRLAEKPFGYAAQAHLIPAVIDEFPRAAREMPVVFAPSGTRHASVFLCGLKPGQNLFVDADGRWNGAYVPAYLRRYPFMLGERAGADPLICIDSAYEGFGPGEAGERLFDDEGKPSQPLNQMIALVTDFAQAAKRTDALCARLEELGLFKSVTIDVQQAGGASASVHGLAIVDEEKLATLPDDVFLDFRKQGIIGALYGHLFSIGATQNLATRLKAAGGEMAAA
jgi:hypothetical protein